MKLNKGFEAMVGRTRSFVSKRLSTIGGALRVRLYEDRHMIKVKFKDVINT